MTDLNQLGHGDTRGVSSPAAAALQDASSELNDLHFAQEAIEELLAMWPPETPTGPDGVVPRALWIAGLVTYARCFMGGVRTPVAATLVGRLTTDQQASHALALGWRNKHLAHAVGALEDTRAGVTLGPAPDYAVMGVGAVGARAALPDRLRVLGVRDTVIALRQLVLTRWRDLQVQVCTETQALTPEARGELPPLTVSIASPDTDPATRRPA